MKIKGRNSFTPLVTPNYQIQKMNMNIINENENNIKNENKNNIQIRYE